jgi:hypothetical protein
MIDAQASLDQQFLDITIGKGIAKVPTGGTENELGGKVPPSHMQMHCPVDLFG